MSSTVYKPTDRTLKFGKWVSGVRHSRGLTQAEFDRQYGVARTLMRSIEKGEWHPGTVHLDTLEKLAHGLDVDLGFMLKIAGYTIGDVADPDLITRLYANIQDFLNRESVIREGISNAIVVLGNKEDDANTARAVDEDIALRKLGHALGSFDLLAEQLRKRSPHGDGSTSD